MKPQYYVVANCKTTIYGGLFPEVNCKDDTIFCKDEL